MLFAASGYRNNGSGALTNVSSNGNYWSFAPISQTNARNLNFNSGNVNPLNNNNRSNGFSVRPCRVLDKPISRRYAFYEINMIYSFEEIHRLTVFGYLKAREHERSEAEPLKFELVVETGLRELAWDLFKRRWSPEPLDFFVLTEPSVREVFAPQFRDRIVSHVLFSILEPIYNRLFIYDSHSCRAGKGTLFGINRFEHHLRSVTNNFMRDAYCLNIDISGYFMSIDRMILYNMICADLAKFRARFPEAIDYGFTDYMLRAFLFRNPLKGSRYHGNPNLRRLVQPNKSLFGQPEGVGLPIGDVINQLKSNIYLNPFDQFVKRVLKIKCYDRYVDDSRQMHESRAYLEDCLGRSKEFLWNELHLRVNDRKTSITSVYEPNVYLGVVFLPFRRMATPKSVDKFNAAMKALDKKIAAGNQVNLEKELAIVNSRLGYLQHFDDAKVVGHAIEKSEHARKVFLFTADRKKAIILNPTYNEVPIF